MNKQSNQRPPIETLACVNERCELYGQTGEANLSVRSSPQIFHPSAPNPQVADPYITKSTSLLLALPSNEVDFTITVGNSGNIPAFNVVTDPLPDLLIFGKVTTSQVDFARTLAESAPPTLLFRISVRYHQLGRLAARDSFFRRCHVSP